jgi:hypothetical protein
VAAQNRQIIAGVTYVSLILISVYALLLDNPHKSENATFDYYVDRYGLQSSLYQLIVFIVYLCSLGVCALLLASNKKFRPTTTNFARYDKSNSVMLITGLCLLAIFAFFFAEYSREFRSGLILTLAIVFVTKNFAWGQKLSVKIVKYVIIISFLSFFGAYLILPFFTPPIFDSNSFYFISNEHYSVLLPGFDLFCCGKINNSYYGLGNAFLVAITLQIIDFLPISQDYLLFFVVRIFQVVAIFLIFLAARLINRGNFLIVGALTALLTSKLNTAGSGVYYPNQSGLRITWFLVGIIILIQLSKKQSRSLFFYALICSILITLNFDTGLMITAGMITLFVIKDSVQTQRVSKLFFSLFSILASIIFLTIISTTITKYFLNGYTSPLIVLFGQQSTNGQINRLNISAVFFIFFGTIYFLHGFNANLQNGSKTVKQLQSALAAVLLFSLFYYFSRMSSGNLWFQVIPFMLMISPFLNKRIFQMNHSHSKNIAILSILTFGFVGGLVFTNAFRLYQDTYYSYLALYRSNCNVKISIFQTLCNTDEDPVVIANYIGEARELSRNTDSIVLSILPTTAKTAGFNQHLPWDEFSPVSKTDLKLWKDWFEMNKPQFLLIDNPKSNISLERPNEVNFNRTMLDYLPDYHFAGRSYYWEKYRWVDPND